MFKKHVLYNRGGAELAIIFIVVVIAGFIAGLYALYWSKKKINAGIDNGSNKFKVATTVSFFSTIGVYAGSVAGLFIAGAINSTTAICDIMYISQSGDCPRFIGAANHIDYVSQYAIPLFIYFALPFLVKTWVSISLGLNLDSIWSIIRGRRSLSDKYEGSTPLSHVALTVAASFILINSITNTGAYLDEICGLRHSLCISSLDTGFFLFDYAFGMLGRLFDPWLNLPYILESSLGNQFQLDNLYPLVILLFGLWIWLKEKGA